MLLDEFRFFFNYYHIQLLVFEVVSCIHLRIRREKIGRTGLGWMIYIIFPFVLPALFVEQDLLLNGWYAFGFFAMMLISGGLLWWTFRFQTMKELMFYVIAAYILQHLVYSLSALVNLVTKTGDTWKGQILETIIFILTLLLFYIFIGIKRRPEEEIGVRDGILIGFMAFSSFVIYFVSFWTRLREGSTAGGLLFESFCGILLFLIQFGMFAWGKLQRENEIMQQILHMEKQQHKMSMENIDLINQKCHDVKHQISALRHISNKKEQEKSIREIESAVMIYDMSVKTGNDALDVVLAEKGLYCEKYQIQLSCIADGKSLGFMKEWDIYSLFGNALDNALESVQKISDPDKRIVSLIICIRGNYTVVHMENYFEGSLAFEDGLPVTTKGSRDYHGFGTRSMRYLTEKYGGTITMNSENGIFTVNMLFPNQVKKE